MSPAKCGLKSTISVPMFSFTTATRGTPSSSSWGFREDSSAASYRRKEYTTPCKSTRTLYIFKTRNIVFITSLHKNHPGRRTAMITAPLVSHRLFALMTLSSADKTKRKCFLKSNFEFIWNKIMEGFLRDLLIQELNTAAGWEINNTHFKIRKI